MPSAEARTQKPHVKWVTLCILTAVYAFSYIDRQLLLILAEPIKKELGLSDTQIGLLGGFSFALLYTVAGLPIAWLADRSNRVRIVAAACALWSLFSTACGLAGNFAQLAVARMGVGIGEAGGTAPSMSILSDAFPPSQRGRTAALYFLGSPFGVFAGTAAGAALAEAYGWRTAFVALSLPGLLLAALILLILKEPVRGLMDPEGPSEKSSLTMLQTLRLVFGNRVVLLISLSSGATAFVAHGFNAWLPAFLMREKGMTLGDISAYFSVVASGSVVLGMVVSAFVVDRFGARDQRAYAAIPAVGLIIALPFLVGAVVAEDWRLALGLLIVPMAAMAAQVPPAVALVQNRVASAQRASASAGFLLVLNLLGLGCGPVFVGMVSDHALAMGIGGSLQVGLLSACALLVIPILMLFWTAFAVSAEERKHAR